MGKVKFKNNELILINIQFIYWNEFLIKIKKKRVEKVKYKKHKFFLINIKLHYFR